MGRDVGENIFTTKGWKRAVNLLYEESRCIRSAIETQAVNATRHVLSLAREERMSDRDKKQHDELLERLRSVEEQMSQRASESTTSFIEQDGKPRVQIPTRESLADTSH